jgi:putative transposase
MRAQGLSAARPRRCKPRTTHRQQAQPIAPNLLARAFTADAPNRKGVADSTGIPTRGGWLDLAGLLAAYSRRAIGYAMDTSRDEQLVETALDMALVSRRPSAGLIHHADRGRQSSSTAYRGPLEAHGIRISRSGKGEPDDHALMESFFSTLTGEGVERHDFQDREQARSCLFAYLEVFSNRQRLHSALGYCSPMAFEQMPTVT